MSAAPLSVGGLLDRAAREHPARVAFEDGGVSVTYASLRAGAERLALSWRARGLEPGDRVALLARNGPAWMWATYACARAGLILVPLNTRLAPGEQRAVLAAAGPSLLLADPALDEAAGEVAAGLVETVLATRVDDVPGLFARRRETMWSGVSATPAGSPPAGEPDPGLLAHLYFTSGTTGRPKGVMLTHRNVVLHARRAAGALGMGPADTWAHIAPMFHLADAWATLAGVLAGLRHVFLPSFSARGALDLLELEGATITNLVPAMLNSMAEEPGARARDWSRLRLVMSGGAPIAPALVSRVMETFRCEYVQTYGMTETSPYLALGLLPPHLRELPPGEQAAIRAKTGLPFPGIELRVVNGSGHPVPGDGRSVGEIEVRGETVTPGYWNAPEETAAAFTDDGFLRTGDLAVVDASGFVDIVDRKKDMIITGGENVYSVEVEAVLAAHPAILEAAVYGEPDPVWGERVCAAVVLRDGHRVAEDDLRQACRRALAGYKVPRQWRFLDALPRTGSGKISKRLLKGGAPEAG